MVLIWMVQLRLLLVGLVLCNTGLIVVGLMVLLDMVGFVLVMVMIVWQICRGSANTNIAI